LQTYQFFRVQQTATDAPIPTQPVTIPDDPAYVPMPNPTWRNLTALRDLARIPTLIVNEPILIMPGATANYNALSGRELYDQYRATFYAFCVDNGLWCLDIWNALMPNDFSDSALHHTAHGNKIIAAAVLNELQRLETF
jgi:hypothetical protein